MRFTVRNPCFSSLVCCTFLSAQTALAQPGFLEEVLVTAEKRETSLQDTAIAVSAFTQGELDRALISKNMDIQMSVPNMLMSKGFFSTANISIRGIGNNAVGAAADPGTGIHFNGVYLADSRIFETEYFDTERVEVLRGPQGTLYGRNTTGGVVNVIAQKPGPELGGEIALALGNHGHTRVSGAFNIPLTDKLWQRFSAYYLERDGFVDNLYSGEKVDDRDMFAVRSASGWQLSERSDVTLVINYFEEDSRRMRGSAAACRRDAAGVLGCLPGGLENGITHGGATIFGLLTSIVGGVTGQPYPADDFANSINPNDPRQAVLDFTPAYEADETIVTLEINHAFGDYRLTSLTGYHQSKFDVRNDYDFTVASEPWPVQVTVNRGPDGPITVDRAYTSDRSVSEPEQWSQEFRLASDLDGRLDFLLGAFYLNYKNDLGYTSYSAALERYGEVFSIAPAQRAFGNDTRNYELETAALFGELYFALNDKTRFTLGLRYTDEEKSAEQRAIYLNFLDDPLAENEGFQHYYGDWQETTGKFNLNYHSSDDVMLFLTLARSYKSGGFNPVSPNSPILDPEQGGNPGLADFGPEYVNSLEIGAKMRLFDNTLRANLTYFYYDYEDLQVSKIVQQTSVNENVDAEIQGLEGEFTWAPDAHWRISLIAAWLDSEIGNFASFDPADPNQMGTTQGIISAGDRNIYLPCNCPGLDVDLQGNQLPNAPEYSINLALSYRLPLSNGWSLDLATMYYYQDEFYARIFNTRNDSIDSWDVWNANARLDGAGEDWYAEAWIRNIQDEDHRTGQFLQDPAVGLYTTYQLLEPRTYGVTLGYRF